MRKKKRLLRAVAVAYSNRLKSTKFAFFNQTVPAMLRNSKQFWNAVKGKRSSIMQLFNEQGNAVPCQHMHCFSVTLSSSLPLLEPTDTSVLPWLQECWFLLMDAISISNRIHTVINQLKISSSCGIDHLSTKFLRKYRVFFRNTAVSLCSSLYIIIPILMAGRAKPLQCTSHEKLCIHIITVSFCLLPF